MRRIGLFGGSFNPVHRGHLLVAQAALEELDLDRVVFVPAAQSPFKSPADLAPPDRRMQLLRLALAACPRFTIDDQELRRGGISYTIDTVQNYRSRFPDSQLYYLIGSDHIPLLPKWRDASELARQVQFIVIPRPGESINPLPAPFNGHALHGFPFGLSSSQVRERVRAGKPIHFLVPTAVAEAIANNRLYL
jgi:nicotinate-nucleotide adenylyltransferase